MYKSYDPEDKEKLEQMFDSPAEVADSIIKSQRRIIVGYKPVVSEQRYNEAMDPKHATLSLTIDELKKKEMTVFIVTNGSVPNTLLSIIKKKSYPTQLYITLPAPGVKNFIRTHRPLEKVKSLEKIQESLRIIGKGVPFRTVGRLTVAEGLNLIDPEGYAEMINLMRPSFVEVKGVVHVGAAEKRIPRTAMPSHDSIKKFSLKLQELTEYKIIAESEVSRLVILSDGSNDLLIPELTKN
jgi:tRNA wybutosine-synthesizing protein 1